jgi:hypothetical protein
MGSPQSLDYPSALAIRNVRLGMNKRAGRLDVLLLPQAGPHKLVLIEAKVKDASDADGKCVGQLMKYLTFALQIGTDGLQHLRRFAQECPEAARGFEKITPKKIFCVKRESEAVGRLEAGQRLSPAEIGLFIAVDGPCHDALPRILTTLRDNFQLSIGLIVVEGGQVRLHPLPACPVAVASETQG